MQRRTLVTILTASLVLAGCSGDINSGMSAPGGITPQVQPGGIQQRPQGSVRGGPGQHVMPGQPTPTPSAPPGNTATYPFADASNGVRCPDVNGFSCIIHLNVPSATSSPKPGAHASASPSPTPSPSPSSPASTSPSPSPSPSATPAITVALEAQPHDVPAMVHADTKSVSTTALIALRLSTNQDILLKGSASLDFILPQGQIGGRQFAVQLFREATVRHRRVDRFIGSYGNSTVTAQTLHFAIVPPQITVRRDETWLLVLYASEKPVATPSPKPKTSATPKAPSPSPNPSPSASPSSSPSATP